MGYSKSSISAIERGERFPGLEIALAIEREFGIPTREWSKDAR